MAKWYSPKNIKPVDPNLKKAPSNRRDDPPANASQRYHDFDKNAKCRKSCTSTDGPHHR